MAMNTQLIRRYDDISFSMLMEALSEFEIMHRPKKCVRTFCQVEVVYDETNIDDHGYRNDALFLCHSAVAKRLMERFPRCFCVALETSNTVPKWVDERSFGNRVVVLHQTERFSMYESAVQSAFINALLWETEMDRVVFSHGRLDRIISVSEPMLRNFVCITDTGHNLIAYSRGIEPPAEGNVFTHLIEHGCYSAEAIEAIENYVLPSSKTRSQLVVMEPTENSPYVTLHYPVYIDGYYLFHVIMVCEHGSVAYLKNLFIKFMKRVTIICNEFWRNTVNIEAPWHRVLIALIGKQPQTDSYLKTQLSKTDLIDAKRFRLYYIPFEESMSYAERNSVVISARKLNGGSCYPFMYNDALVVLAYSASDDDRELSGLSVHDDLNEHIFEPYGIPAGASQRFDAIGDVELAYRQAVAAYALRGPMRREFGALFGDKPVSCFPFEHALKFYLLTEGHDEDIVEYAFSHCFLNQIREEDKRLGTDTALMIWTYISHGRNATETAKLMHVHRNTVLYHLSRIEKRFDISFDSPLLRSRLVLDYQRQLLERNI